MQSAKTIRVLAPAEAGIEDGRNAVIARISQVTGIDMNGWSLTTDLDYKDTDWLDRARHGYMAIFAPVPSRSHTGAFINKDSQGRPLSGKHRYTLTFDLNDTPPVTEFWEIPLYDPEGYFYDNPINRYSLNSYMLKRGKLHTADGKLVIYIQNDEPKDANQRKTGCRHRKEVFSSSPRVSMVPTGL